MMGIKERNFRPLPDDLSLETLVPKDNFYRRLEERIDLFFVRELVLPLYSGGGRHSIDPVVFFKLQLIFFFEDLRSERQLIEVVADRLSLRWYVGYDLDERLPDHSSLTKIRERYGLEVFRRFFERIVEMCFEVGLVKGKELFFDSTKVEADAAVDSLAPRWFVEAHLQDLFEEGAEYRKNAENCQDTGDVQFENEVAVHSLITAGDGALIQSNRARKDWISRDGKQDRFFTSGPRKRTSDSRASRTDPDATPMRWSGNARKLGYQTNYAIDGNKSRIILSMLVTPGEVSENRPILDLLWRTSFRWRLRPHHITGDGKYGTIENIAAVEGAGIRAYLGLHEAGGRVGFFRKSAFAYDAEKDRYICPTGEPLRALGDPQDIRSRGKVVTYRARGSVCAACSLKPQCTTNKNGRSIRRGPGDKYIDLLRTYMETEPYQKAIRKRKVWIEPLFAEGKLWHRMRRFRTRILEKVHTETLMIAAGQNVKRLLSFGGSTPKKLAQAAALRPPSRLPSELAHRRFGNHSRKRCVDSTLFNTLERLCDGRWRLMLVEYARVSKADGSQSTDLQLDALTAAGVGAEHVYEDKASGAKDDRPQLAACLKSLRAGDTLVVWKLDRLGRDLRHLVNIVHDLTERGIGLRVLTGQGAAIDTTTASGKLVFGIFAALAEYERALISERTKAGLASARAHGRMGGAPYKMTPAKLRLAAASMGQPDTNVSDLYTELGITRQTLYRHVSPTGELRPDGLRLS